jgi:hypothetical protein
MPKEIDVTLTQIFCNSNGFGGSIEVSGNIFGATFQNNPNDPKDQRASRAIFAFPDGPIRISEGQSVAIAAPAATFTLAAPDRDGPDSGPRFLRLGGDLTGIAGNFLTLRFDEALPFKAQPGEPQVAPRKFELVFAGPNVTITLTFGAIVSLVF